MGDLGSYLFANKQIVPASQLVKNTGKLLYTEEQVKEVYDPLTVLFRKTMFEEKITKDYFLFKYREYCRDVLGMSPAKVQNQIGNSTKELYKSPLTYGKFKVYMEAVGFSIVEMSIKTLKDGKYVTYSSGQGQD